MSGDGTEQTTNFRRTAFVSHSSQDKEAAGIVCTALEANGYRCWIAPRDIVAGEHWSESIVDGLEECPVFVLIFSEQSHASEQVKREVHRAFEKHKLVIPFKIDGVMPTGSMEYYLGPVHWLTAANPPSHDDAAKLIDHLQRALSPKTTPHDSPVAQNVPTAIQTVIGNLPEIASPYIGRVEMLENWQRLIDTPSTRVMTLVGFGGMGKTRSALDLAHRVQAGYADGVWWVELEEARSGDDMARKIAGTLPIELQPSASVESQIATYLKSRRLLQVLDNVEQIEDAGTLVHRLVKASEGAKFLITSRRTLEIPAEQAVDVPPLPQADAEALFIDRAQARTATFERTADNAADIADICARLEGMPLAVELAATRVVSMTPHEILGRLGEWTKLLQTRAPHLPARQRAIQGAIEWSHDLLTDDDKDLFAQLAVFANGFTLASAESVCDVFDVFEGVHELRRHSFLRAHTHAKSQQMRFVMLELVREFARQKLSRTDIQDRHVQYFLLFAEQRCGQLRTKMEAPALDEMEAELDNLRAAFVASHAMTDKSLCARLAAAMARPLSYLGFWTEARGILTTGIEAADATLDPLLRARLCRERASVHLDLGDHGAALADANDARGHAMANGDSNGEASAENLIGLACIGAGDRELAEEHFNRALTIWRGEKGYGKGMALHNLAMLAGRRGDTHTARTLYEEALEVRRSAGDARGEAETLGNLGALEYNAGNLELARDLYRTSLDIRTTLRDRLGIGLMLHNLGEYYQDIGKIVKAVGLYAHAEKAFVDLQSAYVAGPQSALTTLRSTMGEDAYASARVAGLATAWMELVKG